MRHPLLSSPSVTDWNSDPKSIVYRLMTGRLDAIPQEEWTKVVEKHAEQFVIGGSPAQSVEHAERLFAAVRDDFVHWPSLHSAYSHYRRQTDPTAVGEPPYTSANSYIDCLDYIFHSPSASVTELLMLPPDEIVFGQTALPNEIYSSDHVALRTKLVVPRVAGVENVG